MISTDSKRQEVVHFEMDGQDIEIKFANPGFDLAFVKTVFGVQGDTTDKIIVDLNKNPNGGHTLTFEAFYVLLSRVRLGCNIRVVPWNKCHGKTHLLNLHHDTITLTIFWLALMKSLVCSIPEKQKQSKTNVTNKKPLKEEEDKNVEELMKQINNEKKQQKTLKIKTTMVLLLLKFCV